MTLIYERRSKVYHFIYFSNHESSFIFQGALRGSQFLQAGSTVLLIKVDVIYIERGIYELSLSPLPLSGTYMCITRGKQLGTLNKSIVLIS